MKNVVATEPTEGCTAYHKLYTDTSGILPELTWGVPELLPGRATPERPSCLGGVCVWGIRPAATMLLGPLANLLGVLNRLINDTCMTAPLAGGAWLQTLNAKTNMLKKYLERRMVANTVCAKKSC
jgi:hypothetical protein